jgi:glycosyltransferase involved in cell wall biosynthesis
MNFQTPSKTVSVIIPARDSENVLGKCLDAVKASVYPVHEIIVVNDGSLDKTSSVAKQRSVKTIDLDCPYGANYSRNRGAAEASGDILLFLDSDVVVQVDTIQHIMSCFSENSVDAIVGLYSSEHRHHNLASQYKNLWIRFSYLKSGPRIDWIFGAVSAIRKSAVWKVKGFDRRLFMEHGGDDLELGKRMTASEHNILLKPEIEVEHLKRHSWISLLKNDFARSQGFIQLAGNLGELKGSLRNGFVNVYPAFIFSTLLSWLMLTSAILGLWFRTSWWVFLLLVVIYVSLNLPFLKYFAEHRGAKKVILVLGVIFTDHLVCALGSACGLVRWLRKSRVLPEQDQVVQKSIQPQR